jgi:hypothetical protein
VTTSEPFAGTVTVCWSINAPLVPTPEKCQKATTVPVAGTVESLYTIVWRP